MTQLFEPSSSELMRQIKVAETKCDGDVEQQRLRMIQRLYTLAREWENFSTVMPGDYGTGLESATRACGEQLRAILEGKE